MYINHRLYPITMWIRGNPYSVLNKGFEESVLNYKDHCYCFISSTNVLNNDCSTNKHIM